MKIYFDHEKLDVYQEAIAFCGWVGEFLTTISLKAAAKDQLDRASTSIPLNIAEGNGKFSSKDRARFFEMARGSALECVSGRSPCAKACNGGAGSSCEGTAVQNRTDADWTTSQVLRTGGGRFARRRSRPFDRSRLRARAAARLS